MRCMFDNCFEYNPSHDPIYKMGYKVAKEYLKLVREVFPDATLLPELPQPLVSSRKEITQRKTSAIKAMPKKPTPKKNGGRKSR